MKITHFYILAVFTAINGLFAWMPGFLGHPSSHLVILASASLSILVFIASYLYIQSKTLAKKADFDDLTGLANRSVFYESIEHKIGEIKKIGSGCTVVFVMDLNGFKQINDTLGHTIGDELLRQVAKRLEYPFRDGDTVARLGGDEFGIVLGTQSCSVDVDAIATRVLNLFGETFMLDNNAASVGISIGIAMYPKHGDTTVDIIRCADIAMYNAKRQHIGYDIYKEDGYHNTLESIQLSSSLKGMIANNELVMHYQVKKDLATGKCAGVEALARWQHPNLGMVGPDRFIPAAEHSGYIGTLTAGVIDKAVSDFAYIASQGIKLDSVAINISPYCAVKDALLVDVAKSLAKHVVSPSSIVFEVTETSISHTPDHMLKVLICLDMLGIRLSIDDFGTGQSSLLYLKLLPIKEIKIDRSFVIGMLQSPQDFSIVESTIHLAHSLGCIAVAEGVESEEISAALKNLGCDIAQGYGISKPLPIDDLINFLKESEACQSTNCALK